MDASFKNAIYASLLMHGVIIAPFCSAPLPVPLAGEKKTVTVDYIVIKKKALPKKEVENKIAETPRVDLKNKVEVRPAETASRAELTDAKIQKPTMQYSDETKDKIIQTKDYIGYYQVIREKIRHRLKENYKDYSKDDEVCLVFTLSSDGALLEYNVEPSRSTSDKALIDIAFLSLREAAPFPAFPRTLSRPKMSFTLTISFRKR